MCKSSMHLAIVLLGAFLAIASAGVQQLGVNSFENAVSSHPWTCVLFYDPTDRINTPSFLDLLENMQDQFHEKNITHVGFARLNMRQHQRIRTIYNSPPNPLDDMADNYLRSFDATNEAITLLPDTFMNFELGDVGWPAKLLLFGEDFQVYQQQDLVMLGTMTPKLKLAVLEQWLRSGTRHQKQRGYFDPRKAPTTMSPIALEMNRNDEYHEYKDNSFNFEAYESELKQNEEEKGMWNADIRNLLEAEDTSEMAGEYKKSGPFFHPTAHYDEQENSGYYLGVLGSLFSRYGTFVEGFEVNWSSKRRQREDQMTNFGFYLDAMNEQLRDIINRVLGDDKGHTKALIEAMKKKTHKRGNKFVKGMEKPSLKKFFTGLAFEWGRSPSMLETMIANVTDTMGASAEERRLNRLGGAEFSIIEDMRDFMKIYARVQRDPDKHVLILSELATEFHRILHSFHKNITQHYQTYLMTHSRSSQNNFLMKPMDVIDMKDPRNFNLLSSYDDFHQKYTAAGIPVILSNVKLSTTKLDLEYIVSLCPSTDVSNHIRVSHGVGKIEPKGGWGGLDSFTLPDSLLNDARKDPKLNREKKVRAMERMEQTVPASVADEEMQFDRSISLEQFAILHERIDTLYLHDFSLPGECNRLFHEKMLYDREQKIQIPSVIASYDLFQRMGSQGYDNAWPSLFIGRKGSNSKLHVDSGGTAFFMYLVSGRKRWIVYNRHERPFLYESMHSATIFPDVLGKGQSEEADNFLSSRFPLLHRAEGAFEIIQEPGQLVYIPPDCPHAVENLDDTVGLAMNLVPREGIASHLREMFGENAEYNVFQEAMNYLLFEEGADKPVPTKDPLYTTFAEYKAQF